MSEDVEMEESKDRGSGLRTINLLKLVAEGGQSFTLGELADRAGLPASSAHRLLQPLLKAGFVERGDGQAYRKGSELFRIASLVIQQMDEGRIARPVLHRLWEEWQETSSFCLYKPGEHLAVVVETIQTPHALRFVIEPYAKISLTWGSLGRAILASLPEAEAQAATVRPAAGPLSGLPPASPEEIAQIISDIRAQGFASYRNHEIDAAGVAAPVFGGNGAVIGSLGITAPARRLGIDRVPAIATTVVVAAKELSVLFGFRGQPVS